MYIVDLFKRLGRKANIFDHIIVSDDDFISLIQSGYYDPKKLNIII